MPTRSAVAWPSPSPPRASTRSAPRVTCGSCRWPSTPRRLPARWTRRPGEAAMARPPEDEIIFPLAREGQAPRLSSSGPAGRRPVVGVGQVERAAAAARATVLGEAERTLLTRRRRASDQISHLLGSYCHQLMPLR